MFYQFKSIFRKEWKDMVRDRRTLMAAFAYAVFGPIFLGFFLNFIAGMQEEDKEMTLYIAGAQSAPGLVEFIKNRDMTIEMIDYSQGLENNPSAAVEKLDNKDSIMLIITPDYQENIRAYKTTKLYVYTDQGRKENLMALRKVRRYIDGYSSQIGTLRLMGRGVAPAILTPYKVEVGDLSNSGAQGQMIAELMLLYFILAPFFASMAVAIDVTAGERERDSLQVLLAQPVSSSTLLLGKWAVSAAFGFIGTLITVTLGAIILSNAPLGTLGIRLQLDAVTMATMIAALIPLVLVVSSAQMLVALYAKSFKEGQTYLTMLSFVPAMIGMMRSLTGSKAQGVLGYLPVSADLEVLSTLLQSGEFNGQLWAISTLVTLSIAIIFWRLSAKLLDSERILAAT